MRVSINDEWRFSTEGYFIFKKNGTQLDPNNGEGKILSDIINLQEQSNKQDEDQTEKWITTTYPNNEEKQKQLRKKLKKN